jgi:hypothetical protein
MEGRYRVSLLPLLMLWAGAWLVTVVTWETDAAGYSVGMSPFAIPLHLLLPFLVGVVVGARPTATPRKAGRACGIAGGLFGLIHFGVFWIVDLLWIPPVETPPPPADFAAEAVGWIIGYVIICMALAVLGGKARAAVGRRLRT